MHPVILTLGSVTLYSYGLMLAVAFLVASWQARQAAQRWPAPPAPLPPDQVVSACTAALVGGILGARALYIAANAEMFRLYPLEAFAIWHGGLIWYGGFAGGLIGLASYSALNGARHKSRQLCLAPLRNTEQTVENAPCVLWNSVVLWCQEMYETSSTSDSTDDPSAQDLCKAAPCKGGGAPTNGVAYKCLGAWILDYGAAGGTAAGWAEG